MMKILVVQAQLPICLRKRSVILLKASLGGIEEIEPLRHSMISKEKLEFVHISNMRHKKIENLQITCFSFGSFESK